MINKYRKTRAINMGNIKLNQYESLSPTKKIVSNNSKLRYKFNKLDDLANFDFTFLNDVNNHSHNQKTI